MTSFERLAAIATGQLGAFSRSQANGIGLSDRQLRRRVQSGILIQTGPNAFRMPGAPDTMLSRLYSVVLDIGSPVWVARETAAALHRFDGSSLQQPFHLLVPRSRSVTRDRVVVHRSDTIPPIDRAMANGLPTTSAARTLIDLAGTWGSAELAIGIDSAIRDRLLSEDLLHRRIIALRSQGRYGLPTLAQVLAGQEVIRGGHSWLEREYLRLLERAGLPRPEMQQVLSKAGDQLVRVDCRFPGTNVVVELLGYHFHRSRKEMQRDAARANALLADGYLPYQFTYGHVVGDPTYVTETTRSALAAVDGLGVSFVRPFAA